MVPWSLCEWQGIWWHLNVHTGMPSLQLIIAYVFFTCHSFSMFSLVIQWCFGWDQIFQFAPCAPHHNHPKYFLLIMGAHLLCLESITHHSFQFGPKGFECFLPSMVQTSPSSWTNFLKIWPTMKFFPTSLPPLWSSAPCPFMHKRHQTIATSLWLHKKKLHSNHSRNPSKFQSLMYCKKPSSFAKNFVPWLVYTFPVQFFACSQKHYWRMQSCAPWKMS